MIDGLQGLGQATLISDELLSGYEPQETMSSKNRSMELLLGGTGIFLHLLKVGMRCHGFPLGTNSETGWIFLCPAQPCPAQHHMRFDTLILPAEPVSLQVPPNPELFVSSQCAGTLLFTHGGSCCHRLKICNIFERIHWPAATAGRDCSSQRLANKNRV